ncbi:MAG: hypothetical protein ACOYEA_07585 [Fermentimonas sp.]|jgi:hypothetical protein
MKRIIQYIVTVTVVFMLAVGCKDSIPDVEDITPTIEEKPWWNGMQLTEDGSRVILPEPVTLTIGVSSVHSKSPGSLRAGEAVIPTPPDTLTNYTTDEKGRATVNTFRSDLTDPADKEEFDQVGGEDWIRDLIIPELEEGDYSVTGTIPLTNEEFVNNEFMKDESQYGDKDKYRKVIIRIHKLPTDGPITFFANSRVLKEFDGVNTKGNVSDITYLSLAEPYVFSDNPKFQVTEEVIKNYRVTKHRQSTNIGGTRQLFHSAYLPMFGRIENLSIKDGKTLVTNSGTAYEKEVTTVYLERAVARVKVSWEYTFKDDNGNEVTPILDYIFDGIAPAFYVNVTSIIPNNYKGVTAWYKKFKDAKPTNIDVDNRWVPFYRNRTNAGLWDEGETISIKEALGKTGYFYTYMPENYTQYDPYTPPWTQAQTVTKLRVFATKFKPPRDPGVDLSVDNTEYEVDGTRRAKDRDLAFGPKNADGYVEIRRNYSYDIKLRFKKSESGVQPYIVGTWENEDVDIPW